MYDYDSHASPICYVYQVRRHEATTASICICICLSFFVSLHCNTNTNSHTYSNTWVAIGAKPHAIVSHWIIQKMHSLHYVYHSVECIQKSIITHSEEIDAADMNDVLNNLYAFMYVYTDWRAMIKNHYVVFSSTYLNAALRMNELSIRKSSKTFLFVQREQRVSKNRVCFASILLTWVRSQIKHVLFLHHSRMLPRMVNKNNHQ